MNTPRRNPSRRRAAPPRRWARHLALLLAAMVAAVPLDAGSPPLVAREVFLMGTRCRLATWTPDRSAALARLERFVVSLEDTEAELTTWRDESPLVRLTRQVPETRTQLSPSLCHSLRSAARWRDATAGAFEPAIGPLLDAWDVHGMGRVPTPAERETARRLSTLARLHFDEQACTVRPEQGVRLDTGAFGKGEAIDRLRALPEARSGGGWLVDLGGQIGVGGTPPAPGGWEVGVARADERGREAFWIRMASGSLATTAGSERDLIVDGMRLGHVLDPRTGAPAAFTGSVSVWHELGLAADALSTALYVMGPDAGVPWADAAGVAACFQVPAGSAGRSILRPTRAFVERFPGACATPSS